jgi:hypothetical protein
MHPRSRKRDRKRRSRFSRFLALLIASLGVAGLGAYAFFDSLKPVEASELKTVTGVVWGVSFALSAGF